MTMSLREQPADTRLKLSEYERRCLPHTQAALLLVRSLDDEELLVVARDADYRNRTDTFKRLIRVMGESTNPSWLTSQCAEEAYMRELIDERELDWLTR